MHLSSQVGITALQSETHYQADGPTELGRKAVCVQQAWEHFVVDWPQPLGDTVVFLHAAFV